MNPAVDQEPAPGPGTGPSIHDLVVLDVYERKRFGLAKYGTHLHAHDDRRSLVDAYQEALDLVVYLRKAIAEQRLEPRPGLTRRQVMALAAAAVPVLGLAMVGVATVLNLVIG